MTHRFQIALTFSEDMTLNLTTTAVRVTVGLLAVTMAACSTIRGQYPVDPNEDSQFESLPPAPAIEAPATPALVSGGAPETSSANLGSPIQGSTISASAPQDNTVGTSPTLTSVPSSINADLLKIRVFYFGTNLSDVTAPSYGGLYAHAAYLHAHPTARLQISGHTDERGTREYNLALGERRANAVARFLVGAGATSDQLTVVSYGKEKPAADGHDEEAWSKSRRVELDYTHAGL